MDNDLEVIIAMLLNQPLQPCKTRTNPQLGNVSSMDSILAASIFMSILSNHANLSGLVQGRLLLVGCLGVVYYFGDENLEYQLQS